MALFQSKAADTKSRKSYLAEIKCGRMHFDEKTKLVTPQSQKGLLYVVRSKEDEWIHLCWEQRGPSIADSKKKFLDNLSDVDWLCFENDVNIKLIKQLPDHRVFFIKFTATNERIFFWMQHTDTEKDEELIKNVDKSLNNPVAKKKSVNFSLPASRLNEFQMCLDNINLGDLQQTGETANSDGNTVTASNTMTPAANNAGSANNAEWNTPKLPSRKKMEDLNAFFAEAIKNSSVSSKKYDLSKALNTASLIEMLSDKDIQKRLIDHLPKNDKIKQNLTDLKKSISSPQYQQAVTSFQEALESKQLSSILNQFGLPEQAVNSANSGNPKIFAEAMEKCLKDEEKCKIGEKVEKSMEVQTSSKIEEKSVKVLEKTPEKTSEKASEKAVEKALEKAPENASEKKPEATKGQENASDPKTTKPTVNQAENSESSTKTDDENDKMAVD